MSKRFYKGTQRTEPDMRAEFNATMDGLYPEIEKAQKVLFRRMKRVATDPIITDPADPAYDKDQVRRFHSKGQVQDYYVPDQGYLQFCPCIDKITGESDLDTFCPVCQGERYIWEEVWIDAYRVLAANSSQGATNESIIKPGLTNIPLMVFYTRSSVPVTRADKIVEVWTDEEGQPKRPYRRKALYRIGSAIDFRADHGKLEYWKLDCYEEQRKYLNGPKAE